MHLTLQAKKLVGTSAARQVLTMVYEEVKSSPFMVTVDTDPDRVEYARKILFSKGAIETSRLESRPIRRSGRRAVG